MIVRISGQGQYELEETAVRKLDELDTRLTEALHAGQEGRFLETLGATIHFVEESGTPVAHDRVVPSEVIVPPRDVSMDEARQFFSDEGLMQPLPA